jgi:hypothetical protein
MTIRWLLVLNEKRPLYCSHRSVRKPGPIDACCVGEFKQMVEFHQKAFYFGQYLKISELYGFKVRHTLSCSQHLHSPPWPTHSWTCIQISHVVLPSCVPENMWIFELCPTSFWCNIVLSSKAKLPDFLACS